jgi:hypothetical protein
MKVRLALLGALVVMALASCGLDNSLGGSLGEVFPLDISKVEVAKNDEAMQITYLRNRGVFLDVVVRVSVSLANDGTSEDGGVPTLLLKPGARIDLGGDAPSGVERTAVTHAPGGEPVRTLPRIRKGDLVITRGGAIGEVTGGNFSMLFEQEGGDVGFGRTLTGTFSAVTLDAGFGELP